MTADECAFYLEGQCAPPEEFGFTCQWAKQKLGGLICCANTSVLFSGKDFGAQQIKNLFSGKDWGAEHSKMVFTRTVENAAQYSRELDAFTESVFFEERVF